MSTPNSEFDFDLCVIGGGSGGVRAARMAANLGARVALVEGGALGGTCVNAGCIPKRLYGFAADYGAGFADAAGYGWIVPVRPALDWDALKSGRQTELSRLNRIYEQLLADAGVKVIEGWASLLDPHTVAVGEERLRSRHILVATGGIPRPAEIPGHEYGVTSDDMFDLPCLPENLVVVGGGYIACEFASIFAGLGSNVTLVHRGAHLLSGFDHDAARFLEREIADSGVVLRMNSKVERMERNARSARIAVSLSDGCGLEADTVLHAIGRIPRTKGLGLQAIGVQLDACGAVLVDQRFRSTASSIHAVGDVSSQMQLTPVALAEAMVVVDDLFGSGKRRMGYEFVPTAVFTHPQLSTCGYTEAAACERFGHDAITVYSSEFKPLRHSLSGRSERTFVKLIVERSSDRVVGLHMVGQDAAEIVQGFAVAMNAGATKAQFDATLGVHPTVAEELVTLRAPRRRR